MYLVGFGESSIHIKYFCYRILSILLTLVLQFIIMRDLEKMIGWWRMTLIYMGAGSAGSVGSVIFLPYYVEVKILLSIFKFHLVNLSNVTIVIMNR